MENERMILAIGRIERALSRIENAPQAQPADTVDPALQQRHEALKQEMRDAIQTIDGLIAAQGE